MKWLARLFGGTALPDVQLTPEQRRSLAQWRSTPRPDADLSHYQTRYVVVDVEASGLNMVKDRLISIGAVAVVEGAIDTRDVFEIILRQDEVSTHDNILLHGIGGSAQSDGVEPADALLAFLAYIGKAPLVAYHAEFDQAMIARAMREFLGLRFEQAWLDLAWIMPELFRERIDAQVVLDDWLKLFGIENIQRHNAVSDAYATAKLLQVALAHSERRAAPSPKSLFEIEKTRRWLRRAG